MKIILGSSSTNRQEAMKIAGVKFEIFKPDVDEKQVDKQIFQKYEDRALAIASLKADAVREIAGSDCVIITADGFNECQGQLLEKPVDLADAQRMLELLSNNLTIFYSALVMMNTKTQEKFTAVVNTKSWFRKLDHNEIENYIKTTNVTKYAAAYSPFNTKALSFIKRIEGSASGFSHSLPLDIVIPKLKEWEALQK